MLIYFMTIVDRHTINTPQKLLRIMTIWSATTITITITTITWRTDFFSGMRKGIWKPHVVECGIHL